jgi:hypothetical protein
LPSFAQTLAATDDKRGARLPERPTRLLRLAQGTLLLPAETAPGIAEALSCASVARWLALR